MPCRTRCLLRSSKSAWIWAAVAQLAARPSRQMVMQSAASSLLFGPLACRWMVAWQGGSAERVCRQVLQVIKCATTGMQSQAGAVVLGSGRRSCRHAWYWWREKGPVQLAQGLQLWLRQKRWCCCEARGLKFHQARCWLPQGQQPGFIKANWTLA